MSNLVALDGASRRPRWTVKALAEHWQCSEYTVREKRHRLGLRGLKFGKSLTFSDAEVERAERIEAGLEKELPDQPRKPVTVHPGSRPRGRPRKETQPEAEAAE